MVSLAEAIEEALKYTEPAPVGGSDADLRPLAHLLADAVGVWQDEHPTRTAFPPHAESTEREVVGDGYRLTLRQVGWHGQSGAFYSYFDSPKNHEPGSFSPMWVIAHADRIEAEPAAQTCDCGDSVWSKGEGTCPGPERSDRRHCPKQSAP